MIFGLTIEKLVVIGVIAAFLVGPERLPKYAAMLAQLTKRARETLNGARERMRDELGEDFDVDWRKLDPRQYDPRRIIREALLDDPPSVAASPSTPTPSDSVPVAAHAVALAPGERPPFDNEAT
jgi:sec-independent protein translocase protein TatB